MRVLIITTAAIFLSSVAFAQERLTTPQQVEKLSSTGTFQGTIINTKGKPIRRASVTVEGALVRKIKPNRKGQFKIQLPPGTYEITIKKSGFATYKLTRLEMKSGDSVSFVFRLELSDRQASLYPPIGH